MVSRARRSTEGDEKSYSTWCPLGILTSGECLSPFPFSDSSLCGTFHPFLQAHTSQVDTIRHLLPLRAKPLSNTCPSTDRPCLALPGLNASALGARHAGTAALNGPLANGLSPRCTESVFICSQWRIAWSSVIVRCRLLHWPLSPGNDMTESVGRVSGAGTGREVLTDVQQCSMQYPM